MCHPEPWRDTLALAERSGVRASVWTIDGRLLATANWSANCIAGERMALGFGWQEMMSASDTERLLDWLAEGEPGEPILFDCFVKVNGSCETQAVCAIKAWVGIGWFVVGVIESDISAIQVVA